MTAGRHPRPDTPTESDLPRNRWEDSPEARPEEIGPGFTMVGDPEGAVCVDGVCRVPGATDETDGTDETGGTDGTDGADAPG